MGEALSEVSVKDKIYSHLQLIIYIKLTTRLFTFPPAEGTIVSDKVNSDFNSFSTFLFYFGELTSIVKEIDFLCVSFLDTYTSITQVKWSLVTCVCVCIGACHLPVVLY